MFWTFSFVKILIIINWDFFYFFFNKKIFQLLVSPTIFLLPPMRTYSWSSVNLQHHPYKHGGWVDSCFLVLFSSTQSPVECFRGRSSIVLLVQLLCFLLLGAASMRHIVHTSSSPKRFPPRWRAQLRRSTAGTTLDEWLLNRCRGVSDKETPADLVQASCLVYSWCWWFLGCD